MSLARSGRQFEISHGEQQAMIVEVGATLRTFTVGAHERIDGFAPDEMSSGSRGEVLVPWPNRIAEGRYEFGGAEHQLALNEPAMHNAIHGLGRFANWIPGVHATDRVTMHCTLYPQPGYPFVVALEVDYVLDVDGLRVRTTATNLGTEPCPYGAGFHPYLRLDPERIDGLELQSPAATYYESDAYKIPTGRATVAGTAFDFREPRVIGDCAMDHAFTDLERASDGRARVRLRDPATGDALELWCDDAYEYLMVFTGDGLPDPERRRTGLAVEPMTCAPNAFRTGDGLEVLDPGATTSATWGLSSTAFAKP